MPSFGTSTLGRLTGKRNANTTAARDNASTTDLTTLPLNRSLTSSHAGTGGSGSGSGSELQQDRGRNWNPHRRDSSILSLTRENLTDLGGSVKRSISLRSHRTNLSSGSSFGHKTRSPSGGGGAATGAATTNVFTPLTSTSPIDSPDGIAHFSPSKGKEKETQQESEVPSPTRTISGTPQKERDQLLQSSQAPLLKRKISLSAKGFSHRFKSTEALPSLLNNPAYQESLNSARTPPATSHPNDSSYMLVGATPNAPGRKASAAPSDSSIGGGRGLQSQGTFSSRDGSSHGPPNGAPLQHAPTTASMSGGPLNANNIYVSIHETSAKRMATIDYLRKLHEGDIFYFSTLHYSKDSLSSLPSMQAHKLGRRATNYFILGLSLPALLDMNSSNPLEYLKALSSLLQEFETFQNLSGYDSSGNSFSRGRVGQMFKSGIGLGSRGTKGRRSSTSVDTMAGALDPRQADLLGMPATGRSPSDATSPHDTSPINPTGHEFAFLLTPHLPFEPEFATTLATLCETLIDVYARLMDLVSGPDTCTPTVGSEFAKADKAIRKILIANVVREFEDTTRNGVKHEMAGLGKLTLGGLM